jgi:microcompartment protein CcmL/EutN
MNASGPAIGVIELRSIARGYVALDAACKRAHGSVLRAEPITPGKYWFAIAGGEAEVEESLAAAVEACGDTRVDHTILPAAHQAIAPAITQGARSNGRLASVGALELGSIAAAVRAADAALKAARVELVEMHLARGIGGKGYLIVTGELSDVEAAIDAGAEGAGASWLVGREVIANPDTAVEAAASTPGLRAR